jgi:hypothetical protein
MLVEIRATEDYVSIGGSIPVPRPIHISRCRWFAYWEHLEWRGVTCERLVEMERFMRGEQRADRS